jgi:hypothetical protein
MENIEEYLQLYIKSITNNSKIIVLDFSETPNYISVSYLEPFIGFWNQTRNIDIKSEDLKQFIRDKKINDIL